MGSNLLPKPTIERGASQCQTVDTEEERRLTSIYDLDLEVAHHTFFARFLTA